MEMVSLKFFFCLEIHKKYLQENNYKELWSKKFKWFKKKKPWTKAYYHS
jgi:hypothetical protein